MGLDLKVYLRRYNEVCRARFGRTYDFAKLEKNFVFLRSPDQWLVPRHVEKLFDPALTPFAKFWPRPDPRELERSLKAGAVRLAPLPENPRPLLESLLGVFHNLGTPSLLLRFTYPERFAVFSRSVASSLQVHRASYAELYLAFCEELGVWQQHFKLQSVAETETALWTYQQLAAAENSQGPDDPLEHDSWVERRRASQLLGPFLRKHGALELARVIAEASPKLAGMIAGEEYERLLREEARRRYPSLDTKHTRWANGVIDLMIQDGAVKPEHKPLLDGVWRLRNKAMHPGSQLDDIEVERMIDAVVNICGGWGMPENEEEER